MQTIKVFIFLIISITPIATQAQSMCNVPYNFENESLANILDQWSRWCKIKLVHNKTETSLIKLSGNYDILPIDDALNILLKGSAFDWERDNAGDIVIKSRRNMTKHLLITDSYSNINLEKLLSIWSFNYKCTFDYGELELKKAKIYATFKDEPIEKALEKVLNNTPFEYLKTGDKSFKIIESKKDVKKKFVYNTADIHYHVDISGIIKDQNTGEVLPFATVSVKGTTNGNTTNQEGLFTLFSVPSDTSFLEISYVGYQTLEMQLNPSLNITYLEIFLNPEALVLNEVSISAVKQEQMIKSSGISKLAMSPEIAAILPNNGEKDIFRTMQLLPGISGSNESSSGLYVRGGTPDQNLVQLDGFTVYHVDHLFGFFSAFNSHAIKDIQLSKGGFDAKFGGRVSSVVDITGKEGNTKQFNMGFNLSLISANAFIESPFGNGKGSYIFTFRRSFQTGFYKNIFNSFTNTSDTEAPENAGPFQRTQTQPNSYFYDLNGKVTYRLGKKDKFSFSIYNGEDDLDNSRLTDSNNFGGGGGPFGGGAPRNINFVNDDFDKSNWGNLGSSAKWTRQWNKKFFSNATVSYSKYFSNKTRLNKIEVTREDTSFVRSSGFFENNDLNDLSFKIENEYRPNQNNHLDFGINFTNNDIKYQYVQNDTSTLISRNNKGITFAAYIQDRITIQDKLIITAGLRPVYYQNTNKLYVEPRASATFLASDKLKFKMAYGIYNQFVARVVREDINQGSRDFWVMSDGGNISPTSSTHYIAGASYETEKFIFDIEAYYKSNSGITEYSNRFESSGFGPMQTLSLTENFYTGHGFTKGIDFLIQKKYGRFTGWLGYTLSETKNNFEVYGENDFYANQHSRHEGKFVASYKAGNWNFSGTFIYASGRPYTGPLSSYTVKLLDGNEEGYFQLSSKNALRFDDYHRLDLSINYGFKTGESKSLIGLSLFNLYNRQNTWYKEFTVIESQPIETNITLLGLTPSLFFNWTLK